MTEPPATDNEGVEIRNIDSIRDRTVNVVLLIAAIFGLPVVAASIYRATTVGWQNIMALHIGVYLTILATTLGRRRIAYKWRTLIALGVLYVTGCVGLVVFGLIGLGVVLLIICCIIAAVLGGTRVGMSTVAACLAAITFIFIAVRLGWIEYDIDFAAYATAPSSWIDLLVTFGFFTTLAVVSSGRLYASLSDSIQILSGREGELRRANEFLSEEIDERERVEKLLHAELDLAVSLSAVASLDEALGCCIRTAVEASGMECGGVYLADENSGMELACHEGFSAEFAESVRRFGPEAPNSQLVMQGQPIYVGYSELVGLPGGREAGEGLRSMAAIPIKHDGKVIACLNLASRSMDETPERARKALELISAQIGSAVMRIRAEEMRSRLEDRIRQSEKMEAIGQLAGGVAHDFNNMLAGVLGFSSLLSLRLEPDGPESQAAKVIEESARRMSQITSQLLGFARQGKHRIAPIDLRDTIREVSALLKRSIEKNIRIVIEDRAPCAVVLGDPGQMHQVILNLAINARDAMPQGGTLTIKTELAEFPAGEDRIVPESETRKLLVVSVEDTGAGIPEKIRDRVFEPFFTTKPPGQGTGMGLATVYGIVKNHFGRIEVETEEGRGTVFRVSLPLADRKGETKEKAPSPARTGGGRHILVVDDETVVLKVASEILRHFGHRATAFSDAAQAVEFYREHKDDVDLAIIDMAMPGMDGEECFRALKEINPAVKAILSTGYDLTGKTQEILDQGMAGFLLKPYDVDSVDRALRQALGDADRTS